MEGVVFCIALGRLTDIQGVCIKTVSFSLEGFHVGLRSLWDPNKTAKGQELGEE